VDELEAAGITGEEQLDADIKEAKRQAFRERYPGISLAAACCGGLTQDYTDCDRMFPEGAASCRR
jgi:hypothetical protein